MNLIKPRPVLVGHPVAGLHLPAGLDVLEELLRTSRPRARLPTERSLASSVMATRRDELTREAARLFAERGFHGTSMDALAQALGVQKGVALLADRLEAGTPLPDDARGRARLPRRTRCRARRCGGRRARAAGAARAPARRRGAARRRHRVHARVALPRGRASRRRSWPSAAATRSAGARSSARASSRAGFAPTSTRAPPRSSCCPRRTGPTRGSSRGATRTSWPIASRRSSSTASAATRTPA